MNSDDLYTSFRSEVGDEAEPYLWTDSDVYGYIDSAQKNFCKLTGGLGDASSAVARVHMIASTDWAKISPLILKVRGAYRVSDGRPIEVINFEDMATRGIRFDGRVAPSRCLILGLEPGRVRFYPFPSETLTVQLIVDRLPLATIDDAGQELEVADHHKDGLLAWMKHRAYCKQDAEAFDKGRAEEFSQGFANYCAAAKTDRERAAHKTRITAYGGI